MTEYEAECIICSKKEFWATPAPKNFVCQECFERNKEDEVLNSLEMDF